jgi:gliding motility associated protien GldN
MKLNCVKYLLLVLGLIVINEAAMAQKSRKSTKRTAKTKTKANIQATAPSTVDATTTVAAAPETPASAPANDTLVKPVKKSLRPDQAVELISMNDRTPLNYEYLRADDAVYRHKLMRELDCREKMNLPFMYSADADNGNQRFISILLQALQDSLVTAFSDERFTTPMTKSEISKMVAGEEIEVPLYDTLGVLVGTQKKRNEVNLDSFYRFHIKEEVIFDKESSRLFWRILGIAPVKNIVTSSGVDLGASELFWVYYPDLRPILSKYEVYNGKNFSGRMSWEELFENRMFSARIIKTSMDNPRELLIKNYPGLSENGLLQLFEGENVKERIFNYEQDLWSY